MKKKMTMMWGSILALVVLAVLPSIHAQDQPKNQPQASQSPGPETAFRIQVVVSEFDGAKKISSLPYMITTTSANPRPKLRTGARVPVSTGTKAGDSTIQYIDIGTNIDCTVKPSDDGRYSLDFIVERSSVYVPAADNNKKKEWSPGDPLPNEDPLLPQFRGDFRVLLHDGQTQEATAMTDPLTGHIIKIEVTLNVLK
ncbi:MAG: hypothetical protein ACRD3Q_02940 [Terriglobales bacterium]